MLSIFGARRPEMRRSDEDAVARAAQRARPIARRQFFAARRAGPPQPRVVRYGEVILEHQMAPSGPILLVSPPSDHQPRNVDAWRAPSTSYPASFLCPITHEPFRDPVMAEDGHSYERAALALWYCKKLTSPVTGAAVRSTWTLPNHALRCAVDEKTQELQQSE